MKRVSLRVLVVAASQQESAFANRVLEDHGDAVAIASEVTDALSRLRTDTFDVALVSLSLPRGDGLALVHHMRALHPDVDVIVMALPSELEESAHAMALGVLSSVMLPLTGDGLLVAVDRARERRVLILERQRLATGEAQSRRRSATYARCAAFVAETDTRAVASRVLETCLEEVGSQSGAIYVQDPGPARALVRTATEGDVGGLPMQIDPASLEHVDPSRVVISENGRAKVYLIGHTDLLAVIDMAGPSDGSLDDTQQEALEVVASLGTAAFSAARKVEGIARTGIKDPDTSAYTFAYFGDAAGREIDRAARHGRRFSLVTLGIEGLEESRVRQDASAIVHLRRAVSDAILEAVRDSDVVARVEDDEFYLLLPETGLLGALACRRRIVARLARLAADVALGGVHALDPAVGIAVYPGDGADLGRLLRVSRRRAERSRRGVWRRLGLSGVPFWDAVDRVLGSEDDAGVGRDGTVALHGDLREAQDDSSLATHAAIPVTLLPHLAAAITFDAIQHRISGTLYLAGDGPTISSVSHILDAAVRPPLRVWALGRAPVGDVAERIRLPLEDPRLEERVLLLALTEIGGYALVARRLSRDLLLTYHAADLDLVDGLVAALQAAYHLQPEAA